ncbi:MAG TPA: glycosyl hydrolase 115 family protein [Draconibacterium sp.]|nr:glycosyl hydrolase 115 family protein [Draconibacterium sp.]
MEKKCRFGKTLLFLFFSIGIISCSQHKSIYIIVGENISIAENKTATHLKEDLESVSGEAVFILNASQQLPKKGIVIVVGTPESNSVIAGLVKNKDLILSENYPGKRGGIWAKVRLVNGLESIILAGSDIQGTQYAVYDYSHKVLGIDPLEYWTGKLPGPGKPFVPYNFSNRIIAPPEIPILCYFENDVDELANLKTPLLEYDWESYTEMINALVRMKYNAIHLFDMLGRPEFFQREPYRKIRPDYDVRLTYVDSLINYAHDMGMMVEIDLSLGYKIKPMAQQKADCWKNNKQEWIATWKYYFEETPIKKADIFTLRPRNQVWDWEYKSSCNENKTEVFNEVYRELGALIDNYNPNAVKIATCYADGMEMFANDFAPPEDWIIAWSDDGWGGFSILPEQTKGYKFGTYMHAGFWKNHTVHDPYPEKIDTVMKMMVNKYQATHFWEINGQQFRPFLLNLEAFSELAQSPENFDGEAFYKEWTERYFGNVAAVYAVKSMKKLHDAQFDKVGYVQNLSEINQVTRYLTNAIVENPGKPSVPFTYERVSNNNTTCKLRLDLAKQAVMEAEKGLQFIKPDDTFYNDYILLPAKLYLDLIVFEDGLNEIASLKNAFEESGDKKVLDEALHLLEKARLDLETVYKNSLEGDKNKKWAGWYDPAKRRPNNGFPTNEMLNNIEAALKLNLSTSSK